jgi:Type I restriction modification DNA specificity domain
MTKIKDISKLIQGHQITDLEIYNETGDIPIFTSSNDIKGYWSKSIVDEEDLPCITYPTKANPGVAFIQSNIFDANNTAVLIPKKEWRDKIILEWLKSFLKNKFLKICSSIDSVSYLNKEIVDNLILEIPNLDKQKEELKKFSKINSSLDSIDNLLQLLEKLENKHILIQSNQTTKSISVKEVFGSVSGNAGLTEEFIYQMSELDGKQFEVLSSSVLDHTKMGQIPFCTLPNKKPLKVFKNGYGILVARNGNAGTMSFLPKGNYTTNDHAYILFIKDEFKKEYNINNEQLEVEFLYWFMLKYKAGIKKISTNNDNSTWSKTAFFNNFAIEMPVNKSLDEVKKLAKVGSKLNSLKTQLLSIKSKLIEIEIKDIV